MTKEDKIIQKIEAFEAKMDKHFEQVGKRLDQVDRRFEQNEVRFGQLSKEVQRNGREIQSLWLAVNAQRDSIDKLFVKALDYDVQLEWLKENMVTKKDLANLQKGQEDVLILLRKFEQELAAFVIGYQRYEDRIRVLERRN
jgi:chromosome segregation ATPase